jgi:hypothetical protein
MVKCIFITDFDAILIEKKNSHEYLDEFCSNKIQFKYELNHLWFKRIDQSIKYNIGIDFK